MPAPRRAEMLFRAAQLIADRKEALARDMTREMGKVLDETRGDVQEAIDMTFFMAGEGRRQYGQTVPSELRDKFAMSVRQPLGVCAIITPWNFPMAIPSWKIIPALVCGNTVVFKPATLTPLSALNFVKILEEAGVPHGRRQPGHRRRRARSATRCRSATTCASSRSPDRPTSAAPCREHAAPSFKKVHLEMGGKNVIMVMDDAQPRAGGRRLPVGRLRHDRPALHRGQPRRRAREGLPGVPRRVRRARHARCASATASIRRPQMGPSISDGQLETVMKYVEIGQQEGATLACGGHRADRRRARERASSTSRPIFADVAPTMRIAQEEIFGPVVSVIPCRSFDEAIAIGNGVQYGSNT